MAASDSTPVAEPTPAVESVDDVGVAETPAKAAKGRKAKSPKEKKAKEVKSPREKKERAAKEPKEKVVKEKVVKVVKEKVVKEKKVKEPKEKVPKPAALHPSYLVMIVEAIGALKERTGSSQYAIAKYLEDKYKDALPANFKKTLTVQLRNLTKAEKLVKVKNSFKLSDELKKPAKTPKAPAAPKPAVKVASKAKVAKKPSAAKSKTAGAKAKTPSAKATKPEAKATKVAKPKTVKASAPAAKKPKAAAPAKKAAPAAKKAKAAAPAKKAAPAAAKKPAGRKPPTVREAVTPKKSPKTVKAVGAKAKATKPVAKAKPAKAAGPPAKRAKKNLSPELPATAKVPTTGRKPPAVREAVTPKKSSKATKGDANIMKPVTRSAEKSRKNLSSELPAEAKKPAAGRKPSTVRKTLTPEKGSKTGKPTTSSAVSPGKPTTRSAVSPVKNQSDEDLASRGFSCHSTIDDLDLDQFISLHYKITHEQVSPDPEQRLKPRILRAFQNSQAVSWVQETKTKRLIGFARATGDKVFHAMIMDVMVDPAYQGRGLGKVVMERLLADLLETGTSFISLHTMPTAVGFYQRLGFIAHDHIRVMSV